MKKLLLTGCAALTALSAAAFSPYSINNAQVQKLSPDGNVLLAEWGGVITLYDLKNGGQLIATYGSEDEPYSYGHGNCFGPDGMIVGASPYCAAYLKNGVWTELSVPTTEFSSYAQGITPDAKLIVGNVGLAPVSLEDTEVPMQCPVFWTLQNDGSYSEPTMLPYPELDFTGRVPQYVTALCPSDDGKTIYGQMVDYSGSMVALVVYSQKSDGSWEYKVGNNLLNPNNLEFPAWPGDGPEWVNPEDYMTEEELLQYLEAMDNYDWDSDDPYPEYTDFMTDEEKAAYEAALAAYNAAQQEWNNQYEAFMDVLQECQMEGHSMTFNKLLLAQSGVYTSTTIIDMPDPDNPWDITEKATPMIINAGGQEMTATVYPAEESFMLTAVTSDNTMFGFNEYMWRSALVIKPGTETPIELYDYVNEYNPEVASWIKENMYHDVQVLNFETWELETVPDANTTGTPFCTEDMGLIATAVQNIWSENEEDPFMYTFVLPGASAGIRGVTDEATGLTVNVLKGGRILISGDATDVTVYSLDGQVLYNADVTGTVIETGLGTGAYIVKVNTKNGSKTLKALF